MLSPTLWQCSNDVVKYVATIFAKFRFHGAIKFSFSFRLCGIYVSPVAIIPAFMSALNLGMSYYTWDRAHVGWSGRSLWVHKKVQRNIKKGHTQHGEKTATKIIRNSGKVQCTWSPASFFNVDAKERWVGKHSWRPFTKFFLLLSFFRTQTDIQELCYDVIDSFSTHSTLWSIHSYQYRNGNRDIVG